MCILTMLDIFDALTANDRPYKKAIPHEKALEILQSMVTEGKLHRQLVGHFAQSRVWSE
jgi:HD-GYP domain-containing protein (c-di-GMP phosphodiesterase class II)